MDIRPRAHFHILVAVAIHALAAPAATWAQQTVIVRHTFAAGTDGALSRGSLIHATDGNFYGTTYSGGATSNGTVFKMTPGGTVTVLHAFTGGTDGSLPLAALIQATDGNFYGTTSDGPNGTGTVYMMSPAGNVTLLHAFSGGSDGSNPRAALIQAADGNFYGTTYFGGAASSGTVFKMTPAGTVTVLHSFSGGADGAGPSAALIQATDGNFYGTTWVGGNAPLCGDCGTVFKMTPAGTVTVLHAFTGGTDGTTPLAALLQATDGNFYGTTVYGGASTFGTVFKMTPAGIVTVLHAFAGGTDGATPYAALIQATDGNLYGTTGGGDSGSDFGTLFRTTPAGTATVLYAFAGGTDGVQPFTALVQAPDGSFYGTTYGGGAATNGVVFELTLAGTPAITTQPANRAIGSGTTANLTVVASGGGLGYQWYVGTTGTTTSPIAGATASTYTTPALTKTTLYWVRVSNSVSTADSNTATVIVRIVPGDFDGDGKIDITVYRPSTGTWYILKSSTNYTTSNAIQWGISTDVPVAGDYDGDGKTDAAVYRPSTATWYILKSSTNFTTWAVYQWGAASGDTPVPGDYDGDGRTDIAVYRPSTATWFILMSSTNYTTWNSHQWGASGDIPVPGDYDGDGGTDVAVYRPSTATWFVLMSSTNYTTWNSHQWGAASGDIPVPGDYDGDGRTDIAVYRPSTATWFILMSSTNYTTWNSHQWGASGDIPVPGDYDGDGKSDIAVYRSSTATWFVLTSSTNYTTSHSYQWGAANGDIPVKGRP